MKSVAILLLLAIYGTAARAQDSYDLSRELTNKYLQQSIERVDREMAQERRDEAKRLREEQAPDLSAFGESPDESIEPPDRPNTLAAPAQQFQCTTINMGGGDSFTNCQ